MLTFGHGTLDRSSLQSLVVEAGIETVVDVRRFPGSRANDAAARGEIESMLADAGVGYRWDERLGGRRRLTKAEDVASPDTWWRVAAFRAYCAWTRSADFATGLEALVTTAGRTAIMCSESVWWRCHRRIIADVLVLDHGIHVRHLMHSGASVPHEPSTGARRTDSGIAWDGVDAG